MKTTITPKKAKELLEKNTSNRALNKRHVEFLSKEMKDGKFVFNGNSIVVAKDGTLLDGQHRLHACINSGVSFETVLVSGVKNDAFKTIDTGKTRNASDVLSSLGITYSNSKATSIKGISTKANLKRRWVNGTDVPYTNEEVLTYYEDNSEKIDEYISVFEPLYKKYKMISLSNAVMFAFILDDIDGKGKEYIRQIYTGVQETDSNIPIFVRDRLIKSAFSHQDKLTSNGKRNIIINCYKAYLKNTEYSRMPNSAYETPVL